jgi:hypothetical protein
VGEKNAYTFLFGKSKRTDHVGPECPWDDNVTMYLKEVEWKGVDWIHLAQKKDQWRAVVNTVMNPRGIS